MVDHIIHLNKFTGSCSKKPKRVGRGIGSGKGRTCGAGHKGQSARSGVSVKGRHADFIRNFPKFGFRSRAEKPTSISIFTLLNKIENSKQLANIKNSKTYEPIDVRSLFKIEKSKIKLIGKTDLKFPLRVKVDLITSGCREAIIASGGEVSA